MGGDDQVVKDFFHYVNMTADELKEWLDNPTSMNTGQAAEDGEPKGHKSGKQILDILHKKDKNYSEDDLTHMKHVNSYNKRHLSQGPSKDPEHSKWRYSLMNWSVFYLGKLGRGCDPLKKPLGKLDHSKVSEESEANGKGKQEESKSPKKSNEAKPSSPKKGSAKKEKEEDKKEEKPSSPQKRKSDKPDDDDNKKQRTS